MLVHWEALGGPCGERILVGRDCWSRRCI